MHGCKNKCNIQEVGETSSKILEERERRTYGSKELYLSFKSILHKVGQSRQLNLDFPETGRIAVYMIPRGGNLIYELGLETSGSTLRNPENRNCHPARGNLKMRCFDRFNGFHLTREKSLSRQTFFPDFPRRGKIFFSLNVPPRVRKDPARTMLEIAECSVAIGRAAQMIFLSSQKKMRRANKPGRKTHKTESE